MKATANEIRKQLTTIFASVEKSKTYYSQAEQYDVLCSWCGGMSPVSRPAFIREFGAAVTEAAEEGARADLEAWRNEYARSSWAQNKQEADAHEEAGQPIPTEGAHVWAVTSWLKCDGGRGVIDEIANQVYGEDSDDPTTYEQRALLQVERVITVSPAELDRGELADELCAAGGIPGGGWYEDDENIKMVAPYYLACIKVAAVTDGTRYYFIDSEGYDYARYIVLPLDWRTMYAPQLAARRAKVAAEKAAEQKKAQEEHAAALAEYMARCDQWAAIMEPVAEYEEAVKAAKYRTPEYKAAARKLQAVRRANILAMVRRAFPGVKFSLRKDDGWGNSWELTYQDGPTVDELNAATDLDLFQCVYYHFNGWDDSTDISEDRGEFSAFARRYMGNDGTAGIKVEREMSDATRDELRARVLASVPDLRTDDSIHRDTLTADQREAIADLVGNDWQRVWIHPDGLARELFEGTSYYSVPPTSPEPTTPKKAAKEPRKAATAEPSGEAPADGLSLEEIAGGVAVVGDSRTTYRNRKEIKAHGARWNREAQQWQATDAEAVAQLRAWFGVTDETAEQPDGTAEDEQPEAQEPQTATDAAAVVEPTATATVEHPATTAAAVAPLQEGAEITATATTAEASGIQEGAERADAGGEVWRFARPADGSGEIQLHEIRQRAGWWELVTCICPQFPEGRPFREHYATWFDAYAVFGRLLPGARLIAGPEGAEVDTAV